MKFENGKEVYHKGAQIFTASNIEEYHTTLHLTELAEKDNDEKE